MIYDESLPDYRFTNAKKLILCCLIVFAILFTLIIVLVVAFCIIRPIVVTINDASLTNLALYTTPATALACNLSLTLTIRNPNWAMSIEHTKPLESVYSFGGQKFNRVQLAAVGKKQGQKKTVMYPLKSGADSTHVAVDKAAVAEFRRQNATGVFEIGVVVSGEIKYMLHGTKCKIEASCPLKLQRVSLSPGEAPAALVFDKVKCKLAKANKNC